MAVTIEQRITAASQFTGAAPTGTLTSNATTGIDAYAASTVGGLFTFDFSNYVLYEVQRIAGVFANATSVSIAVQTTAGDLISIYEATSGGDVLITDRIILSPDEKISVTTGGATQAMMVRVTATRFLMRG